ncbi:hypothetical protein GQ53DRAFT_55052 [Thozetella sp. PMI_491]|nr:hypothetical protein GQ53DRAFT_55052 [Thozetella sp. PMI_491]
MGFYGSTSSMHPQRIQIIYIVTVTVGGIVAILDVVTLGLLIYCTINFQKTFGIGYASAIWSIAVEGLEIFSVLIRDTATSRRLVGWLVIADFLTAVFCVVAGVMIALADLGSDLESGAGLYHYVADPWRMDAAIMQMTVGCFHLLLMVRGCISCCRRNRQ